MGVTNRLLKGTKMVKCPKCGFEFSLLYMRAIACQGCPDAVLGCGYARCSKCDNEFPINEIGLASTKSGAKALATYTSKLLSDYYKDFGESPSR